MITIVIRQMQFKVIGIRDGQQQAYNSTRTFSAIIQVHVLAGRPRTVDRGLSCSGCTSFWFDCGADHILFVVSVYTVLRRPFSIE